MRRRFAPTATIRGTLVVLIAVALAPVVLLSAYGVVDAYRDARDAEIAASADVARAAASTVEAFVAEILRAEQAIGVSLARHRDSRGDLDAELASVLRELPAVREMSWLDPEGRVVASTEPRLVGKSLFARDYVQDIAGGATWRVGPLLQSAVDGHPVFVIARGHRDEAGRLLGMVGASVDPDRLGAFLGQRSGGVTSIVDDTGTLVAAQPPRELEWEARRRPAEHPWVTRALRGQEALGIFRSDVTGDRRVGAIVPIATIGWAAHASRPADEALAPLWQTAALNALGALLAIVLALGAAIVLARHIAEPLRALERHAARLAAGAARAHAPRGPVEVRRVGRALDSMAASLAARREELERARHDAEDATREARAYAAELDAVMAALPVGLVVSDVEGRPARVNEAAREILALDEAPAPGGPRAAVPRVPDPGSPRAQDAPAARALRGEITRGEILRLERPGKGGARWVAASAAPVRGPDGRVAGAVTTFVDVTEVHALQEERETLMHTVSHDLRAPLHVLMGQAELLGRRGDEEVRRRADAILSSAGRMKRLVEDLLDVARLEAGQLALRREPVDLRAFLLAWRERFAASLDGRVRVSAAEPVPAVLADPARLDQVIGNLVTNALKYSPPGSEVEVDLECERGGLRVSVRDRGAGIGADDLPRVFERYYRAASARSAADGLGLGLYVTKKLVEGHGWRIEAESRVGEGSVFRIVIPLEGGAECEPPAHATPQPRSRSTGTT